VLKPYEDIPTAMRRHSVEPTVFVISQGEDGRNNIMAAGWNIKCSYEPPMIAVALSKNGYTQKLVRQTGQFVLAVPSPGQEGLLEYVGSVSGSDVDKFAERGILTQPASEITVPLLSEARVNFECVVDNELVVGDHFLFIGLIKAAYYNADRDQVFFAGRDSQGERILPTIATQFQDDRIPG